MSLRPASPWPFLGISPNRRAQERPEPGPRRPSLKVLEGGATPVLDRLSPRAKFLSCVSLTVGVLFAVVAFHVMLTQGQFTLEKLESQASKEQARYEQLRLQEAELSSPRRIAEEAQGRLGMVPAGSVTPVVPDDAQTSPNAEASEAPPAAAQEAQEWAAVKPHLSSAAQ